eukprot:7454707-Ditylum_brightwellii.AAC.1
MKEGCMQLHVCVLGKLCGENGVAMSYSFSTSTSQMVCSQNKLVWTKEDEEGKLEALLSVSLLLGGL